MSSSAEHCEKVVRVRKALALEDAAVEIVAVWQEFTYKNWERSGDEFLSGYCDGLQRAEMILRQRVIRLLEGSL